MAGPFTHMAITDEARAKFLPENPFGRILYQNSHFLALGSVSPDIPYLSHLASPTLLDTSKTCSWADIMHYHQTNGILLNGLHSLKVASKKGKEWEANLAWLCGYVSHLVADATIHPIVETVVGPCTDANTKKEHTICEMVQDIMIFHEVKNLDLGAAEYTNLLRAAIDNRYFKTVAAFWREHAKANCPFTIYLDVEGVINSYRKELDIAEGGSGLALAFRHFGVNYIYKTYEELEKNYPEYIKKYYSEVKLPDGNNGLFKERGFESAVNNLYEAWSKINRSLFSKDNIIEIIPNWNLDTGIDQNRGVRTYWG